MVISVDTYSLDKLIEAAKKPALNTEIKGVASVCFFLGVANIDKGRLVYEAHSS